MSSLSHREGVLPVNKESGMRSFQLISLLRKKSGIRKVGHAGTLDPLASGVMILLIGTPFTKLSSQLLNQDKEYLATIKLGTVTTTFDSEGEIVETKPDHIPSLKEVEEILTHFQGTISQIPPMFSAKKVQGQKLYVLARKGIEIKREPIAIHLTTHLIEYLYPHLTLRIACSKGTYIRTIAHDIGKQLRTGGYLETLKRTRSGSFTLKDCIDSKTLSDPSSYYTPFLRRSLEGFIGN